MLSYIKFSLSFFSFFLGRMEGYACFTIEKDRAQEGASEHYWKLALLCGHARVWFLGPDSGLIVQSQSSPPAFRVSLRFYRIPPSDTMQTARAYLVSVLVQKHVHGLHHVKFPRTESAAVTAQKKNYNCAGIRSIRFTGTEQDQHYRYNQHR